MTRKNFFKNTKVWSKCIISYARNGRQTAKPGTKLDNSSNHTAGTCAYIRTCISIAKKYVLIREIIKERFFQCKYMESSSKYALNYEQAASNNTPVRYHKIT